MKKKIQIFIIMERFVGTSTINSIWLRRDLAESHIKELKEDYPNKEFWLDVIVSKDYLDLKIN